MDNEIRVRNGDCSIPIPPTRWKTLLTSGKSTPNAPPAFEWLEKAREDFHRVATLKDRKAIRNILRDSVGTALTARALPGAFGSAVLTSGLIRDEAAAREKAVRMEGDNRSG